MTTDVITNERRTKLIRFALQRLIHEGYGRAYQAGQDIDGIPAAQVVLVGLGVARRKSLVGAQPHGHRPHDPLGLQPSDRGAGPRAGQVVQRRKRAAISQPRRRLDNVGQAATAAMCQRPQPARRSTELGADRPDIAFGRHPLGRVGTGGSSGDLSGLSERNERAHD